MSLFRRYYCKETDPALIEAAAAAYREAPPTCNTRSTRFAREVSRADQVAVGTVARADTDAPA